MLPVPQLDDKVFEQLMQDAGKMIRNNSPMWTDENLHDPGITFIELFAWLTEMQQFFLDQIGERNYIKFLKLLGVKLAGAESSTVDVSFEGIEKPTVIPRGSKLLAGDIPFELDETMYLTPSCIDKVLVKTAAGTYDYTSSNQYEGICYHAFGENADKGNILFVGLDRDLPANQKIDLTFDLSSVFSAGRESADIVPSARASMRYFGAEAGKGAGRAGWLPVIVTRDETVNFMRSGRISFRLAGEMKKTTIYPANDRERFWISFVLEEEGYEFPPRIEKIKLNTARASQVETYSEILSFPGTGLPRQKLSACTFLAYCGNVEVQVSDGTGGFRYWKRVDSLKSCGPDEKCFTAALDHRRRSLTVTFGDGRNGMAPPKGKDNIRLVCCLPTFLEGSLTGRSTGLCRQSFRLPHKPVVPGTFRLQTGTPDKVGGEFTWYDWEPVANFDSSGPESRHFVLDEDSGDITFGDALHGKVPRSGDQIRITVYQSGGGEKGNIQKSRINGLAYIFEDISGIAVTNDREATGGRERETLEKAIIRARKEMKKPCSAVTPEDYEEIAAGTPGVGIARVKALPLFTPGLKKYPENTAPAQVTVVVVPHGGSQTPVPSKGMLATVKKHLDSHRLVTTELHVIGPAYVKITVHAVVAAAAGKKAIPAKVADVLNSVIRPLDGDGGSKGWIFGRTFYKSDIYGYIKGVDGVEYVKDLWLDAEGAGVEQKPNGDLAIAPYALVYSGLHEIEVK